VHPWVYSEVSRSSLPMALGAMLWGQLPTGAGVLPSWCSSKDVKPLVGKGCTPFLPKGTLRNAPGFPSAREFGTPVDGSPSAGGLPAQPVGFGSALGPQPCVSYGNNALSSQCDARRKRPADTIFVDDEFRDEPQSHRTSSYRHADGTRAWLASSESCLPGGNDHRMHSARLGLKSQAQPTGVDLDTQADAVPCGQVSLPVQVPSHTGGNDTILHDTGTEDKENQPLHGLRGLPSSVDDTRVLRDVVIDVSPELKDNLFSDADSSDDGEFYSENLAEQLTERVQQNEQDRYDFEVYIESSPAA